MDKYMKLKDVPKGQRWGQFWEYYRWQTIGAIFLLVCAVSLCREIFFRTEPDASLIISGQLVLSDEGWDHLSQLMQQYAEDYNGDGQVYVDVADVSFTPGVQDSDPQMFMAMQTRLGGEFQSKKRIFFILDEYTAKMVGADEDMGNIQEILQDELGDTVLENPTRLYLKDIAAFQEDEWLSESLPEGLYLAYRPEQSFNRQGKADLQKDFENQCKFIKNLLTNNKVNPIETES